MAPCKKKSPLCNHLRNQDSNEICSQSSSLLPIPDTIVCRHPPPVPSLFTPLFTPSQRQPSTSVLLQYPSTTVRVAAAVFVNEERCTTIAHTTTTPTHVIIKTKSFSREVVALWREFGERSGAHRSDVVNFGKIKINATTGEHLPTTSHHSPTPCPPSPSFPILPLCLRPPPCRRPAPPCLGATPRQLRPAGCPSTYPPTASPQYPMRSPR